MPRPPNHKLALTLEEMTWVAKTVARKATLAEKSKDKKLKKIVSEFADKLTKEMPIPNERGDYVLPTNRHQLRFLERVVTNTHAVLVATTIPGYDEKAKKDPATFKRAYDGAVLLADMLVTLLNKIKKAL
jgi:hypothetical protein